MQRDNTLQILIPRVACHCNILFLPIREKVLRFLHLTDFHFGETVYCALQPKPPAWQIARLLLDDIKNAVEKHNRGTPSRAPLDGILLGGDYIHSGGHLYNESGWETAIHFVRGLRELYRSVPIMAVPGNHDIEHSLQGQGVGAGPVPAVIREGNYRFFLTAISEEEALLRQAVDDRFLGACHHFADGDTGVTMIALNSCRMERRDAAGWGYIGMDQIHWRLREVQQKAREGDLLIALTHHHLVPCWDLEWTDLFRSANDRKLSFEIDAVAAERTLLSAGCACILFGHVHINRRVVTAELISGRKRSEVLHAGAGTVAAFADSDHHFQILEVKRADDGRFELSFADFTRKKPPRFLTGEDFENLRRFEQVALPVVFETDLAHNSAVLSRLFDDPSYRGSWEQAEARSTFYESWGELQRWREPRRRGLVMSSILEEFRRRGFDGDPAWISRELDRLVANVPDAETLCRANLPNYLIEEYRSTKSAERLGKRE